MADMLAPLNWDMPRTKRPPADTPTGRRPAANVAKDAARDAQAQAKDAQSNANQARDAAGTAVGAANDAAKK